MGGPVVHSPVPITNVAERVIDLINTQDEALSAALDHSRREENVTAVWHSKLRCVAVTLYFDADTFAAKEASS
jgi:hypothetical protein